MSQPVLLCFLSFVLNLFIAFHYHLQVISEVTPKGEEGNQMTM